MNSTQPFDWKQATSLEGRTVVITGMASGIGRASAMLFASAGAVVIGGDQNAEGGKQTVDDIIAAGGKAMFFPLDLGDGTAVDRFVSSVKDAVGAPGVIANVAGWERVGPFLENTPDFWDKLVRINYIGPMRMIHGLLPSMIEARKGGRIITVASDAGRVGSLGETAYAGTKGAIIAFTKSLARETARYGILCNVVCPGPTDTPLFMSIESERLREALVKAIPLKRLGAPADVAGAIVFLATPAAGFIHGQVLSVSGGLTMHG